MFAMVLFSLLLGFVALLLSAAFSGSETAFYRIPKLRLQLDAMGSDRTARRILWFVNNPGLFVATILVGNNVANYAVSMATVLFVGAMFADVQGVFAEIGSTLLLAPFLFVFGEMFPKYLCLRAPNRMLRFLSPVIGLCFRLFLPITAVFWLLNNLLSRFLGNSAQIVKLTLGRQELTRVLDEGQETGLLFDVQRRLAAQIFTASGLRISQWMVPRSHFPMVTLTMKPAQVLEIARQRRLTELPVYETADNPTMPVGYVRTIDLEIAVQNRLEEQAKQLLYLMQTELPLRSTVEISANQTLLNSMVLLHTLQSSFGSIIDEQRHCIGFVQCPQLRRMYLQ